MSDKADKFSNIHTSVLVHRDGQGAYEVKLSRNGPLAVGRAAGVPYPATAIIQAFDGERSVVISFNDHSRQMAGFSRVECEAKAIELVDARVKAKLTDLGS